METRRQRAARLKRRALKLVAISFLTLGIGGWFAVKRKGVGILAILLVLFSFPLMLVGVGFPLLGFVWLGSSLVMCFYPMLQKLDDAMWRADEEAELREQLGTEGAGSS